MSEKLEELADQAANILYDMCSCSGGDELDPPEICMLCHLAAQIVDEIEAIYKRGVAGE
jgi:hypothetical protein